MRIPMIVILTLTLAVVGVAFVLGCSSGGVGGQVSGGTDAASAQATAAAYVQQWAQILWGLVASQTGTQDPSFGTPTINPDGSISVSFTGADGTEATLTTFPDGTAKLEISYPDGSGQTVDQSKPVFDGVSVTTIDWSVSSTTGLAVDYTTVADDRGTPFDMSDDHTTMSGASTLPSGVTQTFTAVTADHQTVLTSHQSDGSTFNMTVPLKGPDYSAPDFSKPVTGAFDSDEFDIDIMLTSTSQATGRWARMLTDFGGGLTGDFALGPDFSGEGRLSRKGSLLAVMSWTAMGETSVQFVTATSGATSPAGAALDCLLNRWQTLAALLAPGGGASAAQTTGAVGRGGAISVQGLVE